jgi:hypothetical protein
MLQGVVGGGAGAREGQARAAGAAAPGPRRLRRQRAPAPPRAARSRAILRPRGRAAARRPPHFTRQGPQRGSQRLGARRRLGRRRGVLREVRARQGVAGGGFARGGPLPARPCRRLCWWTDAWAWTPPPPPPLTAQPPPHPTNPHPTPQPPPTPPPTPPHPIPHSVQYLQQPEKVFAEVYRVLRPGGVAIFTFSNRMFYDKVGPRTGSGRKTRPPRRVREENAPPAPPALRPGAAAQPSRRAPGPGARRPAPGPRPTLPCPHPPLTWEPRPSRRGGTAAATGAASS